MTTRARVRAGATAINPGIVLTFTLDARLPPSVNSYKRHYCTKEVNKNGEHIVKAYPTRRALQYKRDLGYLAKAAGVRIAEPELDVRVVIDVYMTTLTRMDIDNVPKVVYDALNGIAWEDDRQVSETVIRRHWVKDHPHIGLEISYIAPYQTPGPRLKKPTK